MIALLLSAASPPPDVAQVLRDVHAFYEAAWGNLVVLIYIFGGVIAVVIPAILILVQILVDRSRGESFRAEREALERRIDESVEKARQQSVAAFAPDLEKLAKSVQQTAEGVEGTKREIRNVVANTMHTLGAILSQNGRHLGGAAFVWLAARRRFELGLPDERVCATLDVAHRILAKADAKEALDDREPLDGMAHLVQWFPKQHLGALSAAVLPRLVAQYEEILGRYHQAKSEQAKGSGGPAVGDSG